MEQQFTPPNFGSFQGNYGEFYTILFNGLYEPLYGHFFGVLGNHFDTEDVIQNAFVKFWMIRDRWIHIENMPGYLYQQIRNGIIDLKRAGVRFTTVSLPEDDDLNAPDNFLFTESLNLPIAREFAYKLLDSMLEEGKLTVRRKSMVELYLIAQKTPEQIAVILGIDRQTVYRHIALTLKDISDAARKIIPGLFIFLLLLYSIIFLKKEWASVDNPGRSHVLPTAAPTLYWKTNRINLS